MTPALRANDAFYTAADRFLQRCLRSEGSLFTPDRSIWCAAPIGDLYGRLVENQQETRGADFIARLRAPLEGASKDVVQLAAEVLYVLVLPQDTSLASKRENVIAVLGFSSETAGLPDELSEALARGIASYGAAISQRFAQYVFLLEFANAWIKHQQTEREALLADADRFREFVFSLPRKAASSQVEALLHMVFPDQFEPIVSVEVKRKIADAFGEYAAQDCPSIDKRIASIRRELEGEYGTQFSFYDPRLRVRWEREKNKSSERKRAWLVRAANNNGASTLEHWFDGESISLAWPDPNRFSLNASEQEIRGKLGESSSDASPGQIRRAAGIGRRFLSIAQGDLILTADADKLYVARVKGDAYWSEGDGNSCLKRPVEWLNRASPTSRVSLRQSAPSLYARLQTLQTVSDLKDEIDAVWRLLGIAADGSAREDPKAPQQNVLPPVSDEMSDSLYLPRAWLQEAIDLLHEKRQLIFYGPPGTGKTFVAQAVGEHVRAAGGDWQLVQFHPAYSYEDFFEGYRPSKPENTGALQFSLRAGPLRLLAQQAAKNPGKPYLLVIDEINRGNIAKIFGELYFLLEYRERPIRLQYSPELPFVLPKNLFVIGTMNTADRSIALVDSALRRRFYFFAFLAHESPVGDVLGRWLGEKGYDGEASLLLGALNQALQEALPDEEFAIGPSYFMTREGPPNLERVWRYAIGPLLEERFCGLRSSQEIEREFGLQATRARLAGNGRPEPALESTWGSGSTN